MKAPLIHVASMVFNSPLAILPEKLEAILRAIGPRLVADYDELAKAAAPYIAGTIVNGVSVNSVSTGTITVTPVADVLVLGNGDESNGSKDKPYRLTPEGVAIIPIRGTLMKRYSWMSAASGCSSYAGLQQAATDALADPQVKGVLFDVDSPGGTTHGCFELSDALYQMRGDKPMWAVANDLAASAAYALASAVDRIFLTRTAAVGSIGVFALHCDQTGLDETMGNKYTYIYAGGKKTDGNPHQALTKSARADIQAEVDREYDMFVATVARNREKAGATPQKVRGTEAAVYFGDNATGMLADEVATFDEALEDLTRKVTGSKASETRIGLQTPMASANNGHQIGAAVMPAIPPHKTATSDKPWNGPKAKKNLRQDADAAYYRSAYAFAKPGQNPKTKAGYSFIHHEVSSGGDVGAANIKGCQTSIGVLNGGRGGTVLKGGDRKGVYNHVAKHLRDAKLEPAPLVSYTDYIDGVIAYADLVGWKKLRSTALEYLVLGEDAVSEEQEGEEPMAKKDDDETMRRSRRSAAEDADAESVDAADKDDDQDEDDGQDDKKKKDGDDDEEADEGKKGEGKKGEGRRSEGKKSKKDDSDDDADDDEDKKGRRGSVREMPMVANNAAKQIASLCTLADAPELAADYIAKGYTVDEVMERLNKRRAKASADGGVSSYVTGETSGSRISVDHAVQQARVLQANSGGTLSMAKAFEQILRANPEIYENYMAERDDIMIKSPSGRGRALTEYVMGPQRRYMTLLGLSSSIEDVPARRPMA